MNSSGNNLHEDFKNLCSLLLLVSPEELLIISSFVSLFLVKILSTEEQNVFGSLLQAIGGNLQMVAAQEEFFKTVADLKKNNNS